MDFGERLGKSLDRLVEKVQKKYEEVAPVAKETFMGIGRDIEMMAERGEEKLGKLVDKVVESDYGKDIGKAAFDAGKKGAQGVREAVREKFEQYNARLNEDAQRQDRVGMVGFWDGFANAYTGSDTNRRPNSQIYLTHRRYGKAIGFAAAAYLFFGTRSTVGRIIGSLPVVTRTVRYMKEKITDARETVERQTPKPKPVA